MCKNQVLICQSKKHAACIIALARQAGRYDSRVSFPLRSYDNLIYYAEYSDVRYIESEVVVYVSAPAVSIRTSQRPRLSGFWCYRGRFVFCDGQGTISPVAPMPATDLWAVQNALEVIDNV